MGVESGRLGTTQVVVVNGTSTALGSAFGAQTRAIRVTANTAVQIEIGDGTPSATTVSSPFFPANWSEYFTVTPGQNIAAVTAPTNGLVTSTNGRMWVTELT